MMKRWLCTVDRPSDHDHLFTREAEGCEEPLECDGTTRQSRGAKWHVARFGGRLLVSGSDLGSPVRKGVRERSGVSRLKRKPVGQNGVLTPGMREKSRKVGKRAWEVGSAPWNEQTRISEVGSAADPTGSPACRGCTG
ncbi:hypothetical protein CRG98_018285 [Punica granatum]|uniref:Uncharacterized protein n=1 Tax=Punica granatum TaxID=22663 RepID=A0A2I0JZP6_PUNGR|nr:hypothetical protein CRG98_018285 [Punica granatum]